LLARPRAAALRARPSPQLRYDADADSDSEGDAAEEGAAAAQGPTSPAPARKAEGGDAPDAATATAEEAEEHDAAEDVRRAFAAAYADAEAGLPPAQHPPSGADVASAHPAPPLTGTEVRPASWPAISLGSHQLFGCFCTPCLPVALTPSALSGS